MGTNTTSVLVMLFSLAILFIVESTSTITSTYVVAYYLNVSSSCRENEREALVKIKDGLMDPANHLSSWIGKDCCAWKGVGCSSKKIGAHVLKLDLHNPVSYNPFNYDSYRIVESNMLGGEIGPSLLKLKHLNYLDLSMNNLTYMPILDSLKSLTYLDLSSSMFGRGILDIPSHLGNLSRLRYLNLSYFAYGALNPIHIVTLCNLSSLVYMDLSQNYFSSPIPHCLGSLTSLTYLDLTGQYNGFESSIPSSLCKLKNLVHLDLNGNSVNGSIPRCLGNLTSLTYLDLSSNRVESSIPSSLCKLNNLVHLDLSRNSINDSIPLCLGNQTSLSILRLNNNRLHGPLPIEMGNMRQLIELALSGNKFSGDLSTSEFTGLIKLQTVKLVAQKCSRI